MKTDTYTQSVLTIIALLLGIIALERASPTMAVADVPKSTPKFANILFAAERNTQLGQNGHNCYFFNTSTGDIWEYDSLGTGVENTIYLGGVKELGKPAAGFDKSQDKP